MRTSAIPTEDITGLVLAGGRGSRMGGVDKGLQNHLGMPLALHCLLRLQLQVGSAMVNANRNLGAYESMGVPVWPDLQADFAGPLAGMLVGLEHCETPWLEFCSDRPPSEARRSTSGSIHPCDLRVLRAERAGARCARCKTPCGHPAD